MIDSVSLLNRLRGVMKTGKHSMKTGERSWFARCPAHEDKTPSLSITETHDRFLLHCFAGCDTEDVLQAIGLDFPDILPARHGYEGAQRPATQRVDAHEVLASLDHESLTVAIIGADFIERRSLDERTWQRLATAVQRINLSRSKAAPLRHKVAA